jgi:hypothetical protein
MSGSSIAARMLRTSSLARHRQGDVDGTTYRWLVDAAGAYHGMLARQQPSMASLARFSCRNAYTLGTFSCSAATSTPSMSGSSIALEVAVQRVRDAGHEVIEFDTQDFKEYYALAIKLLVGLPLPARGG